MRITREWAMPSPQTFSIQPVASLLDRWLTGCAVVVDPFSNTSTRGTHRNDLAFGGIDATDYCRALAGLEADAVLFDPPYSPRQITEVYQSVGRTVGMEETQSAVLYREVRDQLDPLLKLGGIAISFGWNSVGFGIKRGYQIEEIMLVCHGGAHNDTIVTVERKQQGTLAL